MSEENYNKNTKGCIYRTGECDTRCAYVPAIEMSKVPLTFAKLSWPLLSQIPIANSAQTWYNLGCIISPKIEREETTMKRQRRSRLGPVLLAAAMLLSLLPPLAPTARAAAEAVTGSISATVRIDYDQSLAVLQKRQVKAELLKGGASLGSINLTSAGTTSLLGGYTAQVSLRDASGGPLYSEWPSYLDLSVDDLPQGMYTLRFTGTGYVPYEETFAMEEYAHHLIVGTGDATFTLGDLNNDNQVDEQDRALLSAALGSGEQRDLDAFDLNGDGIIDIIDLAYINRQIAAQGGSQNLETTLLLPPVDETLLNAGLIGSVASGSSLSDLFRDNGAPVTLTPDTNGSIVLPITFRRTTELEEVRIVSSSTDPILAGTVVVEDEQGQVRNYSFDNSLPAGIHALSLTEGSNVITIDLGSRVAVKKITITVTKTEKGSAVVESIQFLKEMIPADPSAANSQVTGLAAEEGSERVTLSWNRLPNISGYRVTWWPTLDPTQTNTLSVEVNRAEITGLENQTEYQFTVTAVDGTWSGKPSAPVSATPQPASAPKPPDLVSVSPMDGALSVGWKAAKGATYYELYYTTKANASTSDYTRFGGTLTTTGTTLTGLQNGVTYYLYIVAGNDLGRSGPSRISTGTPQAVVYERPAGIPTQGVLDWRDFASIRLAAPSNYDRNSYTSDKPFTPQNMADGDYRTHWTVRDWWSNEHVIVTFKEPQDLSAAIWVPRLDGTYTRNLRAYSVQVWYEGDNLSGPGRLVTPGEDNGGTGGDVHTWPAIRGNVAETKFAVMPFTPQRRVVQVSVAAEQAGYTNVSLSELMFLKYDESRCLPDDIAALFSDELCTALAAGVTADRIAQLRQRLNSDERNYYMDLAAMADELELAQTLLTPGLASNGVVINGIRSISGSRDSEAHKQGGSDLQPLGVAAAAGQEITVYASGIPAGQTLTVYASQFNAEANTWLSSMGALQNGRNVLTVPKIGSQNTGRGGSLYFTYSGSSPESIRLHVRRAEDIPVLDLSGWNATTPADRTAIDAYIQELNAYMAAHPMGSPTTDWRNVTEIATPSVLLSLPAAAVSGGLMGGADQLDNSVQAWEQIMSICRTVQGITGTMETRQNIRCMQMFTGAFMYAAGSHVGIGYNSCAGMVGGAPVRQLADNAQANNLFGWGIAHEIGHNMDKLGKAEITNNIYALAVQTYDGKSNTLPSRLEKSGKYAAIFNKTAQARPGASGDVFVQLGMYWQLHLAYDNADNPLDFYSRFFSAWKNGTYFNGATTYDDKVALTASAVVGYNLTDFFTHWGMTLSGAVVEKLATYNRETRAIWYLNDESRRDRLGNVSQAIGTVAVTAVKDGDTKVNLTITPSITQGKVQGYEIFRNNDPIAFVSANGTSAVSFTDEIGSGNNRTYIYTVKAYDTLGNFVYEHKSPEISISYDLLVDSSAYQLTRSEDGAVQISFTTPTAVSGLKLPLEGLGSGDFQITVTDEKGVQTVARAGNFDATPSQSTDSNSYITYFHAKDAPAGDDQIWTYQAKSITITGIPAAVTDIQLISYAGDSVEFYNGLEGPTVGRLAEAFRYGPGAENVIPKDTLVIAGRFRGDPVYNVVHIKGKISASDMAAEPGDALPDGEEFEVPGYAILFVNEQDGGVYTTVHDGIFLFVPTVQEESALKGDTACGGVNVLPSLIRAELWRTDEPNGSTGSRLTAQTMWIASPGGEELPLMVIKGGNP